MARLSPLCALFCLTLLQAAPAWADDLRIFATCTGRLSALMEHQWLMQDPAADRTEAERDAFADLVQAIALPGQARMAMALRIEAKAAMASALQAAEFGGPPAAKTRLMAQVAACLRLLPQA